MFWHYFQNYDTCPFKYNQKCPQEGGLTTDIVIPLV
jgi:hypothetical protein